mgnify:CR=1 FL=1
MSLRPHYGLFAPLFEYPDESYREHLRVAQLGLEASHPAAAEQLNAFADLLPIVDDVHPEIALNALQEIFTRSFEVQSITTLDVGYVIFGDDYKRAELLVNLNREQRTIDNDCGSELSDHLPNVLRLMVGWADLDLAEEFVQQILHPALQRMIEEFHPERMEVRNELYKKHHKTLIVSAATRTTMFRHLLKALYETLAQDYEFTWEAPPERSSEFLRSIRREMEIATKGAGQRPSAVRPDQMPSQPNCPSRRN